MYTIGKVLYMRAINFHTLSFNFLNFKSFVLELQTIHIFISVIDINSIYNIQKIVNMV